MIGKDNKTKLLNSIRTILYNDSLDLQKRIDLLKNIPNNDEIVEDIIDDLLNQSDIFDFNLSKINKDKFEEWCKKEIDTIRISHNIKMIENDFNEIIDYNRIVIPGSVKGIYSSFCNLSNIKEIEFLEPKNENEKGLSVISDSSFYDSSIEKIKLPNTLNIINGSFNNSHIGELDLNEEISYLRSSFNYTNINRVNIPKSIKYIDYCFNDCNSLVELILNEGLEEINHSFEISNITNLSFPKSLLSINNSFSFSNCLNQITLNEGLQKINYSFNYCPIKEIKLPDSLKNIKDSFNDCNLRKVLFSESMYEIMNSFKNNKDLSEINDNLKIYLLVTAYYNNYYQELDINTLNLSFTGTKIYKKLEEKSRIYTQPEIIKILQYQIKKGSPFMKK